ncbi:hypothetical protein GCM10007906_26870 [Vibrio hyugaensis]|uniref:DUF3265 domain-containing protein n=1 Tax=Vibrio hyugaensis TaxID=1534743 RepID=A0ABQ5Y314_9VIBR|nr:hypothetical protein GCM10007906_26870 [Vibrio hyugaensis]
MRKATKCHIEPKSLFLFVVLFGEHWFVAIVLIVVLLKIFNFDENDERLINGVDVVFRQKH